MCGRGNYVVLAMAAKNTLIAREKGVSERKKSQNNIHRMDGNPMPLLVFFTSLAFRYHSGNVMGVKMK